MTEQQPSSADSSKSVEQASSTSGSETKPVEKKRIEDLKFYPDTPTAFHHKAQFAT